MDERRDFAERLCRQLRARYPGVEVTVDPDAFALRVRGAGSDASLALGPLLQACRREPAREASHIAGFVRGAERQLSPRSGTAVSPSRLLWCVRGERYLEGLARGGELVTRPLGAGMVAFIAEELPGSLMRGLAAGDLEAAGLDAAAARRGADANTRERFSSLPGRIRSADRIPADGWRLGSDVLFQGSALLVPEVLDAFAERSGGDVLLAVPDRSTLLAIPAAIPGAARFHLRVTREWREAMNPVSHEVLVTDGAGLRPVERAQRPPRWELLGWLWR